MTNVHKLNSTIIYKTTVSVHSNGHMYLAVDAQLARDLGFRPEDDAHFSYNIKGRALRIWLDPEGSRGVYRGDDPNKTQVKFCIAGRWRLQPFRHLDAYSPDYGALVWELPKGFLRKMKEAKKLKEQLPPGDSGDHIAPPPKKAKVKTLYDYSPVAGCVYDILTKDPVADSWEAVVLSKEISDELARRHLTK